MPSPSMPEPEQPRDPAPTPAVSASREAVAHALRVAADDAAGQDYPAATLYVIATPIGNRADITVRALACLVRVDAVAAEDTRTARQLLRHYGIDKPMIVAHRHNENAVADTLVARLAAGERIAYVSDAGTPGISDPGARLVNAANAAGHRVIPIPGASALSAVLSIAGLPEGAVQFVGFLPSKSGQATTVLQSLSTSSAHLVFYEAPHRIVDTLASMAATFAGRRAVVAREVTKRFESIHRGEIAEAATWVASDPQRQRGEFVVVVEAPRGPGDAAERAMQDAMPILAKLRARLTVSDAASLAADLTGVSRKALYAAALAMRRDDATEGDDGTGSDDGTEGDEETGSDDRTERGDATDRD